MLLMTSTVIEMPLDKYLWLSVNVKYYREKK